MGAKVLGLALAIISLSALYVWALDHVVIGYPPATKEMTER